MSLSTDPNETRLSGYPASEDISVYNRHSASTYGDVSTEGCLGNGQGPGQDGQSLNNIYYNEPQRYLTDPHASDGLLYLFDPPAPANVPQILFSTQQEHAILSSDYRTAWSPFHASVDNSHQSFSLLEPSHSSILHQQSLTHENLSEFHQPHFPTPLTPPEIWLRSPLEPTGTIQSLSSPSIHAQKLPASAAFDSSSPRSQSQHEIPNTDELSPNHDYVSSGSSTCSARSPPSVSSRSTVITRKKVRGAFTEAERKRVHQTRSQGACIRCRSCNKKCTGGFPCELCKKRVNNRPIWKTPCVRYKFTDLGVFATENWRTKYREAASRVIMSPVNSGSEFELYYVHPVAALYEWENIDAFRVPVKLRLCSGSGDSKSDHYGPTESSAFAGTTWTIVDWDPEAKMDGFNLLLQSLIMSHTGLLYRYPGWDRFISRNRFESDTVIRGALAVTVAAWMQWDFCLGQYHNHKDHPYIWEPYSQTRHHLPNLLVCQINSWLEKRLATLERELLLELQNRIDKGSYSRTTEDFHAIAIAVCLILGTITTKTRSIASSITGIPEEKLIELKILEESTEEKISRLAEILTAHLETCRHKAKAFSPETSKFMMGFGKERESFIHSIGKYRGEASDLSRNIALVEKQSTYIRLSSGRALRCLSDHEEVFPVE